MPIDQVLVSTVGSITEVVVQFPGPQGPPPTLTDPLQIGGTTIGTAGLFMPPGSIIQDGNGGSLHYQSGTLSTVAVSCTSLTVSGAAPALTTTTVTAGTGLTGGGDLSANRTISLSTPVSAGNGGTGTTTGLTVLNASNLSSGTLADARLSSNVALKNINNSFSIGQTITASSISNTPLLLQAVNNQNTDIFAAKLFGGGNTLRITHDGTIACSTLLNCSQFFATSIDCSGNGQFGGTLFAVNTLTAGGALNVGTSASVGTSLTANSIETPTLTVDSVLYCDRDSNTLGFFAQSPVTQQSTPVDFDGLIAVLQAYGLLAP